MTTHTETQRVVEAIEAVIRKATVLWDENVYISDEEIEALSSAAALITRQREEIERLKHVDVLARALIADVRTRHPGEELQCPFMVALNAALEATK